MPRGTPATTRDSTIAEFTVHAHTIPGRLIGVYDEQSGRPMTAVDGHLGALPPGAKAGDFEAVEMYSSTGSAPMEYGRKARVEKGTCGVLLLWSRERR